MHIPVIPAGRKLWQEGRGIEQEQPEEAKGRDKRRRKRRRPTCI